MQTIDTDLWTDTQPHRFMGVGFGARMTVVRLADGGLWVHSPIACTAERRAAVDALGPVRHIVAPSLVHHVFVPDWADAYPDARVWIAPGLSKKQPDLRVDGRLDEPAPWDEVFARQALAGNRFLGETLFFHRPSRTIISADLVLNMCEATWGTKLFFKLNGAWGKPAVDLPVRLMFRDKPAARAAVDAILAWEAERLVIAHGEIIEGAEAVREAIARPYAFLG